MLQLQELQPMSLTDILQSFILLFTLIGLIISWIKNGTERRKLQAETSQVYSDMLDQSAAREKKARETANDREVEYEKHVMELSEKIHVLEKGMNELKEIIEKKDDRIQQLQKLTQKQEVEIKSLRKELETLKSKN